jgi:acyl dehydratase
VRHSFGGLPSMVVPYLQVVLGRKPMLAPTGYQLPLVDFEARKVRIRQGHLARYRRVCGIPDGQTLPHAYLHALAMPLHMKIFTAQIFPAKVLGLVHLRNVIRSWQPIDNHAALRLAASARALRETDGGQEYDIVTRAYLDETLAWEEVSTMLARRQIAGKRPIIERANLQAGTVLAEERLSVAENTGRRYAFVSGDFNPIHLTARTAQLFKFKQAVAHGMWSLARCVGRATEYLPRGPIELDGQFKLPIYLPSEIVFRAQSVGDGVDLSLATPKADRLHFAMQVRKITSAVR